MPSGLKSGTYKVIGMLPGWGFPIRETTGATLRIGKDKVEVVQPGRKEMKKAVAR